MRPRFLRLTPFLLAALVTPLLAARPSPRVEALLGESPSPGELRAHLIGYTDSLGTKTASAGFVAGDAWYYAGLSFDRGGKGDSAIALRAGSRDTQFRAKSAVRWRTRWPAGGPGDVARAADPSQLDQRAGSG
jgi:hypothetical protein